MSTKIEWTDETWNPVTGCTKVSQGCKNCYAERLAPKVFAGQFTDVLCEIEGGRQGVFERRRRYFTDVRCHPERLLTPLHWAKPRRVFVNSMSDLFHEDVPDEFILKVFDVMRQGENGYSAKLRRSVTSHDFQILTKRAERMRDFCTRLRFAQMDERGLYLAKQLPHNGFNPMASLRHVWLGVSVEDQPTADERIPLLLRTPAAVRFISAEPLLAPIDLTRIASARGRYINALTCDYIDAVSGEVIAGPPTGISCLDWVIAGGESGPEARPSHPDWFRSLRDQCKAAGVAFFFKQWGEWDPAYPVAGGDIGGEMRLGKVALVQGDGRQRDGHFRAGDALMRRVGKKAAGRLLDGRMHDEYPR